MTEPNLPTTQGLYWASELPMTEDWELIVKVQGQIPFLQCTIWEYLSSQKLKEVRKVEKLYFGPRISIPERDPRARPKDRQDEVY